MSRHVDACASAHHVSRRGSTRGLSISAALMAALGTVGAAAEPGDRDGLFVVYTEERDTAGARVAQPWDRGLAVKMNGLLRY